MPALINLIANIPLGAAFAWAVKESPAMRRETLSWIFFLFLAFEAVVVTPLCTFMFRFYPQWSMLYWFDPQIFSELDNWTGVLSIPLLLLHFATGLFGFLAARRGLVSERKLMWQAPLFGGGVVTLLLIILFANRIAFVGDYDTFWQGNATFFLKKIVGFVGVTLYVLSFLFVLWVRSRFAHKDPKFI